MSTQQITNFMSDSVATGLGKPDVFDGLRNIFKFVKIYLKI